MKPILNRKRQLFKNSKKKFIGFVFQWETGKTSHTVHIRDGVYGFEVRLRLHFVDLLTDRFFNAV